MGVFEFDSDSDSSSEARTEEDEDTRRFRTPLHRDDPFAPQSQYARTSPWLTIRV